jgi:sulfonate transport system substrate-binding protein
MRRADGLPTLSRRTLLGAAAIAGLGPRPARAAGKVLRIGVQKYGTLIILRERHTLEQALQPLGWQVTWHEFPGGPQLLEALAAGALDFGTVGEAPPVFAQAAGAPLLYVGFEPPSPAGEAILVPKDSPIHSVAGLKGKRVALNKGSNVHYLLVRALASVNLTPADISPAYLAPADARAAFESGGVDAWVIWDPFLAAAQDATGARVLTDGTGLAPNRQFFLATRDFAREQPDVLRLLNAQVDATDHWAEKHQPEATRLLAASMGLPEAVVRRAVARMGYGVQTLTPEVVADQQKIANTFFSLQLIPDKIDVATAVWRPNA